MAGVVTADGVFVEIGGRWVALPPASTPLAQFIAVIAEDAMISLDTLVDQVESKYPAVIYRDGKSSRATAAADLVRAGKVEYLGEQSGRDWWTVDGHRCSIRGGCDCLDNAPLDPNGRKLCKHRLAVMFVRKQQEDHGLVAILRAAASDQVTLTVQVLYADKGRQYTLGGYRAGGEAVTLEYNARIRFTEAELTAALRVTGFGMPDRPIKLAGMNYRYILVRGAESNYGANSLSGDDAERAAQRQRMAEIADLDAAAVTDPIMQSLPPAVQAAILNHAGIGKEQA